MPTSLFLPLSRSWVLHLGWNQWLQCMPLMPFNSSLCFLTINTRGSWWLGPLWNLLLSGVSPGRTSLPGAHRLPKRCSSDLWVIVLVSSPSGWGQLECSSEKHILLITDLCLLRVLELRMSLILSVSHTAGARQNKASSDFKVYVFNSSMVPMSSKGLLRLKLGLTNVR